MSSRTGGFSLGLVAMGLLSQLFIALTLAASAFGAAAGQPVSVTELDEQDQYYVRGSFETPAQPEAVFAVLSDYDNLAGVLSGLRSSRVLDRDRGQLLVEQVLQGSFLFFRKTVRLVLLIDQQAPLRIEFQQAEKKPFRHYQGSWLVEPMPGGTRVDYTLTVSRGDMAPVFVERKLFRENAKLLLVELKKEVARRAAAGVNAAGNASAVRKEL